MDTMGQVLGKFAGIGDVGGKSLLSILGPIVLGTLGQQQRTAGLDASGLASLLRSQKDQFTAALPPGLADQLGAAGLIDRAELGMRSGAAAASSAASAGASRVASARPILESGGRSTSMPSTISAPGTASRVRRLSRPRPPRL